MKIRVIKDFNDLKHDLVRRHLGEIYEDETIRVHELIERGFAEVYEDDEEQATAGEGE